MPPSLLLLLLLPHALALHCYKEDLKKSNENATNKVTCKDGDVCALSIFFDGLSMDVEDNLDHMELRCSSEATDTGCTKYMDIKSKVVCYCMAPGCNTYENQKEEISRAVNGAGRRLVASLLPPLLSLLIL